MSKIENNAPFRADIVGSFLRPAELKEARKQFSEGRISADDLKKTEDRLITELVHKQKAAGLKVATDGEFRRSYWHLDFFWGLEGIEHNVLEHGYLFHDEETRADSARLEGKVRFNPGHPFLSHFAFLKSVVSGDVVPKQTIPAPAQLYAELLRGENAKVISKYYNDTESLVNDIAEAYNKTILALYDLGCRTVQIDDCTWGCICDKDFWESMAGQGFDMDSLQTIYLTLNNKAIANLPSDLVVNTHICRGNYHSTWAAQGGYEPVAKRLFGEENVNAYYLEYDTDRAGGFEPLKYISGEKKVVLGLITTKFPELEDKATVIARIHEASKYVPLERLYLSPQCGFASTEEGNILTEEQEWAKIALVQEIAKEVWK